VTYELTAMGHELQPALDELRSWARQWLAADEERRRRQQRPVRTL
jgi:DNA-binding HxlR family transcriptional regulator